MNPKGGGPSEGLRQLARVADHVGLEDMEIVSFDPPGSSVISDIPIRVHAIGPAKSLYQYCSAYRAWLQENAARFDAVLVRGLWQYPGLATRGVLHGSDVPYFVFPHGMLDPWFKRHYPLKHLKKWLYWAWGEYRVLRDARAVMFTCEEERRLARESFWLYKANECVINYGTARPQGNPEKQRELFFTHFTELRGKRILLFLSRIHEKKGCDLLIKAFGNLLSNPDAKFPNSTPSPVSSTLSSLSIVPATPGTSPFGRISTLNSQLHLVIAGPCADPAYIAHLRRLTSDLCPPSSVTFPGMLSGDLKWGAFHAADAFVLPSHQENFGIAVAESLACGLPVLISDKVNIWREIEQDRAGLVADDSLEGTRDLLTRWLQLDEAGRQVMRTAATECFDKRFEINRAAESLHAALTSMIRKEEAGALG